MISVVVRVSPRGEYGMISSLDILFSIPVVIWKNNLLADASYPARITVSASPNQVSVNVSIKYSLYRWIYEKRLSRAWGSIVYFHITYTEIIPLFMAWIPLLKNSSLSSSAPILCIYASIWSSSSCMVRFFSCIVHNLWYFYYRDTHIFTSFSRETLALLSSYPSRPEFIRKKYSRETSHQWLFHHLYE